MALDYGNSLLGRFEDPTTTAFTSLSPSEGDTAILEDVAGLTIDPGLGTISAGSADYVVRYSGTEWVVVDEDSGGGGVIPTPHGVYITRNVLAATSNSNNLEVGVTYVINYSRGTITNAKIAIHAVDTNKVSTQCELITDIGGEVWQCEYDLASDRLLEVQDKRGNYVYGRTTVDSFPWGNTSLSGNTIKGSFSYSAGLVQDNIVGSGATLRVNGGVVQRNTLHNAADLTVNSGDAKDNTLYSDATVTSSTSGDVDHNTFGELCNVTVSGNSNIDECHFGVDATAVVTASTLLEVSVKSGSLTITDATLRDSEIQSESIVILITGTHYGNTYANSTSFRQYGNGFTRFCKFEGNTTINLGDTNLEDCRLWNSSLDTRDSTGRIYYMSADQSLINIRNIGDLTLDYVTFEGNSSFGISAGARLNLYRCSFENYGRVLLSAGATINARHVHVRNQSYIRATVGTLTIENLTCTESSYVQQSSSGSTIVNYCNIRGNSRITTAGDSNNARISHCDITSSSYIQINAGAQDCYIYYCTLAAAARLITQNNTLARIYYCTVFSSATLYASGNTAQQNIFYCHADSRGSIYALNNTAFIRMYALSATAVGSIRLQNCNAASNLYYSSATAYYYMNVTRTGGTSQALHGYGRLSNNVTNPPNGTPVDNF